MSRRIGGLAPNSAARLQHPLITDGNGAMPKQRVRRRMRARRGLEKCRPEQRPSIAVLYQWSGFWLHGPGGGDGYRSTPVDVFLSIVHLSSYRAAVGQYLKVEVEHEERVCAWSEVMP